MPTLKRLCFCSVRGYGYYVHSEETLWFCSVRGYGYYVHSEKTVVLFDKGVWLLRPLRKDFMVLFDITEMSFFKHDKWQLFSKLK